MLIDSIDRTWVIRSPAKLNLFLEVLGKRADGYHEIDSIMCPVTLFDELHVEENDSDRIEFSIAALTDSTKTDATKTDATEAGAPEAGTAETGATETNSARTEPSTTDTAGGTTGSFRGPSERNPNRSSEDAAAAADWAQGAGSSRDLGAQAGEPRSADPAWDIPADQSNLVVRALRAVQRELGIARGCRVRLYKRIPAAAGMGGGSSDAASAIVAALALWWRWDRELARRVASSLGSDIPLFLGDAQNGIGLARATGRGERIEILSGRPPLCFVISHPPVGSSTAEVYRLWAPAEQTAASRRMLAACSGERAHASREIEESLFNALQAPASRLNDWIPRQLECFARLGQTRAMMTGSGSACFALVDNSDEGHKLSEQLIQLGLPRAYTARAWYAAPIERQLERIALNLP
ncbi:MAG: 4-(cytidine 5'-diphospho)-2-C-methyl-D-erythritol kinase [Aureliella sp.]